MPRPRRSTFTMPSAAQSSLSHWITERPGIVAGSSGTTASSRPRQITMPPECWPRWRGRSWMAVHSRAKCWMRGSAGSEPASSRCAQQRVAGIVVLPVADELGQSLDEVGRQAEGFPHLARAAPAAIGNHVGRHGRAVPAVALVDVLDDLLAAVAARQVEVDVGPLPALLGEEALEEQLHAHRIDRRDLERVAHRAVRRRAPPLDEDVVPATVLDQIPDDEEVTRQVQASDETELALDLLARPLGQRARAVPRPGAALAERAEKAHRRLPRPQRIVGELIAEMLQREAEPERQLARVRHGLGAVEEEPLHHPPALHESLAVPREQPAGLIERGVLSHAGQHVEQMPIPASDGARLVGGEERQAEALGLHPEPLVARLLAAVQMTLKLHVHVEAAIDGDEPLDEVARGR